MTPKLNLKLSYRLAENPTGRQRNQTLAKLYWNETAILKREASTLQQLEYYYVDVKFEHRYHK